NARDAMPKGGKLDIDVTLQTTDDTIVRQNINAKIGKYVVTTVRDSGEGIPPEIRDRIFDPFFTTKAEGKGTGLGLATVFTIVKNHGGFINVYSEVGNGTSFKVYLPAHITADKIEVEEEQAIRRSGKQEVILVVDDEELIRTISRDILIENGYVVIIAQNGEEAAEIYREKHNEISMILTDVMMPIMNGIELIEIVQKINPDARIVAASGLMQGEIASKLAHAKVSGRLSKPFTADKLLAAVHQALQV
ncbi:MAG: response regulator, partial [Ignavibacteriae bacterium]|nr:response regulator [Ignavibacteriota bacterium]